MKLRRISLFLLASFTSFLPSVLSQSNMTSAPTCMLASFQWSYNSHHQSPCSIAASLLGVCNGGTYQVQPISPGHLYLGPTLDNANGCQCSTVAYSVLMACAACQNASITAWSVWSTNCAKVFIDSFPEPIPTGISVPGYAYLDVKASDTFDPNIASRNANLTESTAVPEPTTTTSSAQSTSSSIPTATPSVSSSSSSVDPRTDKIGNAVIGSVIGLAAILGLFAFLYFRRRQKISSLEAPESSEATSPESPVTETKQVPSLIICPPSLPYQSMEPLTPGAHSNSTISDSEGSLKQTLSRT